MIKWPYQRASKNNSSRKKIRFERTIYEDITSDEASA